MEDAKLKLLEKELSKARFKLSQQASELHDLIEDRLCADFKDIPLYADAVYKAGLEWEKIKTEIESFGNQ